MLKGIDEIRDKSQSLQDYTSGNRINRITIGPNETAVIRFITDGPEVIQVPFHNVEKVTPNGKWWTKNYCTFEDLGQCIHCTNKASKTDLIFLWAFHYYTLHKTQNPKLEEDSEAERWERMLVGKTTFYKEEINKPRILRTGIGKSGYIKNLLIQFNQEYETLCDRDYKWSRTGKGLDTTYSLMAKDKNDTPEEVIEAAKDLPDLEKVASGEIFTLGQLEGESEPEDSKDTVSRILKKKKDAVSEVSNDEDVF